MSPANFKLKRTAAASRGFLATARFSCCYMRPLKEIRGQNPVLANIFGHRIKILHFITRIAKKFYSAIYYQSPMAPDKTLGGK